ncbi:MAG TPA: hypothetical protein VE093_30555 [Polyangiaceae bacterium]|nr:hypothetical protein [Polyangiaceae bacterium]
MYAAALFENGGFKVREGETTVGFLWVEPVPGVVATTSEQQLQRWVLTKPLGSREGHAGTLTFERWQVEPPMNLSAWEAAVRKPIPEGLPNDKWGENPTIDGLWPVGVAAYIVAQSRLVRRKLQGETYVFVDDEPIYPRKDVTPKLATMARPARALGRLAAGPKAAHVTRAGGTFPKGPTTLKDRPRVPPQPWGPGDDAGQIVIPLAGLYNAQTKALVGLCGASTNYMNSSVYFTSEEAFLLYDSYQGTGTQNQTTWDVKVDTGKTFDEFSQARAYMKSKYNEGFRFEVAGCNYYVNDEPPPAEFV